MCAAAVLVFFFFFTDIVDRELNHKPRDLTSDTVEWLNPTE